MESHNSDWSSIGELNPQSLLGKEKCYLYTNTTSVRVVYLRDNPQNLGQFSFWEGDVTNKLSLAASPGLEPGTHSLTGWRATDCATGQYIPTTKITNSAGTISLKTSLVMFCSIFHLLRFLFIYCSSNRKPHIDSPVVVQW